MITSSDTSSELMQLSQTKPIRTLDHHHCGIGNIYSHLNH
jgi:hypothetical protein